MDENLKEFQKMSSLLNSKPGEKPTEEQIESCIAQIEEKLQIKAINRYINAPVKEGYIKAVEILKTQETDHIKANIADLKSTQGRAIAFLAIDFLKGECTEEMLCNVPIKDR